jgi:predicted helicase
VYQYGDTDKKGLFGSVGGPAEREPNLDPSLLRTLGEAYRRKPTPEEILRYIYGVLHAPIYRAKYSEFLKIDFPRVPFTREREVFARMSQLGLRLLDRHLLKASELDAPIARFQGSGDNRVEKQAYNAKDRRVYINQTQ